jgi:hypothetical protein
MRYLTTLALAIVAVLSVPSANFSQGGQMEASRGVEGGGVHVKDWTGKIDAKEAEANEGRRRAARHDWSSGDLLEP